MNINEQHEISVFCSIVTEPTLLSGLQKQKGGKTAQYIIQWLALFNLQALLLVTELLENVLEFHRKMFRTGLKIKIKTER
jgi:hypothetical protein